MRHLILLCCAARVINVNPSGQARSSRRHVNRAAYVWLDFRTAFAGLHRPKLDFAVEIGNTPRSKYASSHARARLAMPNQPWSLRPMLFLPNKQPQVFFHRGRGGQCDLPVYGRRSDWALNFSLFRAAERRDEDVLSIPEANKFARARRRRFQKAVVFCCCQSTILTSSASLRKNELTL